MEEREAEEFEGFVGEGETAKDGGEEERRRRGVPEEEWKKVVKEERAEGDAGEGMCVDEFGDEVDWWR